MTSKKRSSKRKPKSRKTRNRQIILDEISSEGIKQTKDFARHASEYHWSLYSDLAFQRSKNLDDINSWIVSRTVQHQFDAWQRIVKYQFSNDPLSMKGSLLSIGSRFNVGNIDLNKFPRFPGLYLAEDQDTAKIEVFGQLSEENSPQTPEELALTNKSSYSCVAVNGVLESTLDLREKKNLKRHCRNIFIF